MELNGVLINFKHITNFTAITSVKIKPAPHCLAELRLRLTGSSPRFFCNIQHLVRSEGGQQLGLQLRCLSARQGLW